MKNATLINSAFTRNSFGAGSYGIEIFKYGKGIVIREGEPQRMSLTFRIAEVDTETVSEMESLSEGFLLEKGFTSGTEYASMFTHFYKSEKWHRL